MLITVLASETSMGMRKQEDKMKTETFNDGDFVACDFCNGDEGNGGGMIGSNAVCPKCLAEAGLTYPDEISERFDVNKTFHQNVLDYRQRIYGTPDAIWSFTTW
jgi:hypothetical protein